MKQIYEKVCVIGLGYIGLPTAALLANRGFEVHGVDIVQHVVETINSGKIHIIEPELDTFVSSAINSGKLKASTIPSKADVFILAVPTPFNEGFTPNIDYIINATRAIAPFVKEGNLIILESTSPVGTTETIETILKEEGVNTSKIHIAHCPERVLPGQVMRELIENDRIIGGLTNEATQVAMDFYKKFVSGDVFSTNARTAELCKLVENASRDVNISFANELSMICDKANIDVWELIRLANRHPRVNILRPGCGVGGHCIAVDPWFIVSAFPKEAHLIKTAREVNDFKTLWVIEKIKNQVIMFEMQNGRKAVVSCMGLSFKPNIDDLRESPALEIFHKVSQENIKVLAVEPNISILENAQLVSINEGLDGADIICFLVNHDEFKELINSSLLVNKIVMNFTGIGKYI